MIYEQLEEDEGVAFEMTAEYLAEIIAFGGIEGYTVDEVDKAFVSLINYKNPRHFRRMNRNSE